MKETASTTAISFALALGTLASTPVNIGGQAVVIPSTGIESQSTSFLKEFSPFGPHSRMIFADATQTTIETVSHTATVVDFARRMNASLVDIDEDIAEAVARNFWSLI